MLRDPGLRRWSGRLADEKHRSIGDRDQKITPSKEGPLALEALQRAVKNALDKKKRLGQYAVIWEDGKKNIIDFSENVKYNDGEKLSPSNIE